MSINFVKLAATISHTIEKSSHHSSMVSMVACYWGGSRFKS